MDEDKESAFVIRNRLSGELVGVAFTGNPTRTCPSTIGKTTVPVSCAPIVWCGIVALAPVTLSSSSGVWNGVTEMCSVSITYETATKGRQFCSARIAAHWVDSIRAYPVEGLIE